MRQSLSDLLIPSPANNFARAHNSGLRDAYENRTFRAPVGALYGAYCDGWLRMKRLPAGEG